MYELSPKALARIRDYESRYSKEHRAMMGLALKGQDPELLMNPHLGDYADLLLPALLTYATALQQMKDTNSQVSNMGIQRVMAMTPEIQRLCSLVNAFHALDVGQREIPNRKFAESKLVPLVLQ